MFSFYCKGYYFSTKNHIGKSDYRGNKSENERMGESKKILGKANKAETNGMANKTETTWIHKIITNTLYNLRYKLLCFLNLLLKNYHNSNINS